MSEIDFYLLTYLLTYFYLLDKKHDPHNLSILEIIDSAKRGYLNA